MANSELKPIHVPMLREKLGVLYLFSRRIKTDTAFGQAFAKSRTDPGVTDRAVRNWISGYREDVGAEHVPGERFEQIVEIYREALPGQRTPAETAALLVDATPAGLLHAFCEALPAEGWMSLVARARPADVRLANEEARPKDVMGLTGRGALFKVTADWVRARVNCPFRFEFGAGAGWVAVIQWLPTEWRAVELEPGRAVIPRQRATHRAPTHTPYFLETDPFACRYVFLESAAPFPPLMAEILNTSAHARAILDAGTLTQIARLKSKGGRFEITSLDVAFHQ